MPYLHTSTRALPTQAGSPQLTLISPSARLLVPALLTWLLVQVSLSRNHAMQFLASVIRLTRAWVPSDDVPSG